MLGKQAKTLSPRELCGLLDLVSHSRHPVRDRVMVLLSFKAGLRAKEIAALTWSMVLDAEGGIAEVIALPNNASKGRGGGGTIPMHTDLVRALQALRARLDGAMQAKHRVIYSERADGY